ncbi:MAG: hypothetical protein HRU32_12750 [Rhodobacteraceae bacterium]|nr:hypothetical protein [Paracoccaceae bacterium]
MEEDQKPRRRRRLIDVQVPFFIPMWRRIVTMAVLVIWTGIEFWRGSYWWGALAGGIGIYVAHQLFIAFDPRDDQ